jgi:hypothetical protein
MKRNLTSKGTSSNLLRSIRKWLGLYTVINNNNNPWRYSSDEPWPAEQPPLAVFPDCNKRYWVDMCSAHRIPQLHFQLSAFQTGPLLLYSSNYSVYPITRLSGPRSRPNPLRKILRSTRESNPRPLCL